MQKKKLSKNFFSLKIIFYKKKIIWYMSDNSCGLIYLRIIFSKKRVILCRFNITLNWNLGGSFNHFSIMLMKADWNNYIKNYSYVNCIECELDNDEIYWSSIIKHCLYLHQIDDENSTFENFEILNQFMYMFFQSF